MVRPDTAARESGSATPAGRARHGRDDQADVAVRCRAGGSGCYGLDAPHRVAVGAERGRDLVEGGVPGSPDHLPALRRPDGLLFHLPVDEPPDVGGPVLVMEAGPCEHAVDAGVVALVGEPGERDTGSGQGGGDGPGGLVVGVVGQVVNVLQC
ncbi:hypothetical protein KNE206_54030 [Kitasatospora sp. NE20-6]